MACPQQQNLEKKRGEKRTRNRQLAFEMREGRPEYVVTLVPVVTGTVGGQEEYKDELNVEIVYKARISRKVLSRLVQID